jgi:vacuolar-type H+-ATPase subunit E/Vma4
MYSEDARRELEAELRKEVRKAGEEFLSASAEMRDAARERYAAILDVFNALVHRDVRNRPPQ